MSSTIAIVSSVVDVPALVRAVKAGALGVKVEAGSEPEAVIQAIPEEDDLRGVFCDADQMDAVLLALGPRRARVFGLSPEVQEAALVTCLEDARVGGLIAVTRGEARSWEITFLARRMSAPN
ncbi:MAG: hypothetical protein KC656_28765, partial [Myxococcales bacterium]|nr:hypothetical protein [Myxococcales bacterium]